MLSDDVRAALFARRDLRAKQNGERVHFRCPRHDDRNPSAWMGGGAWGCFACGFEESITTLADALGVEKVGANPLRESIEATFDYVDENGTLLYQVVRYIPKRFIQRKPDGRGGWEYRTKDVRRVLYRLPEVLKAVEAGEFIYITEGEKHADRLARGGLVATTNCGGAGKWLPEYSEALRGAHVVILPDNDEPGERHAQDVARSLFGIAETVRIVRLDGLEEKGDVLDWLTAGHTLDELSEIAFDTPPLHNITETVREDSSARADEPRKVFVSLAELLERPELLEPPEAIIPRLAYRGRLVVLAAPDKAGKSTLVAYASAILTRGGWFLGAPTRPRTGRVVLLGLEEHIGDPVRRYKDLGADPEKVCLLLNPSRDLLQETQALLAEQPADLLIVDSLQEFARVILGTAPDDGDNAKWAAVIRPLVAIAREHDIAVVVLHHVRRSDGQFRGAGEIAAAADMLLELVPPASGEDPNMRRIRGRGRWAVEPFSITLVDGHYELTGGGSLSLDARVLLFLEKNPGSSMNAIRKNVGGRATTVDAIVGTLLNRGAIVNLGTARAPRYALPTGQAEMVMAA